MPSTFHDGHVNAAFDHIARVIEQWLERSSFAILDFAPREVAARLAQRVVQLGLPSFGQRCIGSLENGDEPVVSGPVVIDLDGLLVDLETGEVRPTRKLFLKFIAEFFKHWLYVFVQMSTGKAGLAESAKSPMTLVLGTSTDVLFVDRSDARFIKFCRQGPITPLATAHKLVIEAFTTYKSADPEHFSYSRRPLVALARMAPVTPGDRLKFVFRHVLMIGAFLRAILRRPIMVILARDFAYMPLVKLLDRVGAIETLVITNSYYDSQPLWMRGLPGRRFAVHMIWYSQNTRPFVYSRDRLVSELPNSRRICVDVAWVWTEGYARYLKKIGIRSRINVVGPIMWQLPETGGRAPRDDEIRVAVFDVTPVTDRRARTLGVVSNYYRTENMIEFISGILSLRSAISNESGKPVRIRLKHKREYAPFHDPRYVALIDKLLRDGEIELIRSQSNIYSFLSDADFAIVVPYSSPAYVASSVGKAAIYFDPTCELVSTHEAVPKVSFASGREELLATVLKILREARPEMRREAPAMHTAIHALRKDPA